MTGPARFEASVDGVMDALMSAERAPVADVEVVGRPSASAYEGLAKSSGIPVSIVLEAAQRDDLRSIVKVRERLDPRSAGGRVRDSLDAHAVLLHKLAVSELRLRRLLAD